ncbi:NADH dehydrogenase [ubiquinone] iron-sulfur protein 6, mitochondrial [Neocloeon triangulifer]|uniref:NADH dehydrogenase [ubiquinone] iron-sulfur protein 6, mitochondrial n=1 Tax=Neocloeon triangulifer TaxID=2078957 RepID=UPI00286ED341|nr:NADH dehydrogenase [ubiquinone] iron-sulfur protein 6, mitochondrial [Neocloeon triangulifer]
MAAVKNIRVLANSIQNVRVFALRAASSSSSGDTPTHTGQQFEKDDYRLARFIETPKQVNKQFAIDLINKVPPTPQKKRVISCDGGGGPTGHPKVYINLDKPGNHICGYCGLRFYKDGSHH